VLNGIRLCEDLNQWRRLGKECLIEMELRMTFGPAGRGTYTSDGRLLLGVTAADAAGGFVLVLDEGDI